MYRSMRLLLLDCQSIQQPLQLPASDAQRAVGLRCRPFEASSFEPPVVEPETVVIPAQNLQFVALPVTKHEPLVRERIQLKHGAYQCREPINGFPQVCCTRSQVHLCDCLYAQHKAPIVRSKSTSRALSNPGFTSRVILPNRMSMPEERSSDICNGIHRSSWLFSALFIFVHQ